MNQSNRHQPNDDRDHKQPEGEVIDFKSERLKRKTSWEYCVICGQRTSVQRTDRIDRRAHYVEGVGQLCAACHRETQG